MRTAHVEESLTFEKHGINDHCSVCLPNVLGDLGQFATSGFGGPIVDRGDGALLVPEVDLGLVAVVVFLTALDKIIHKGDGAGSIQATAQFPGDVTSLCVSDLRQELSQTRVQLLILNFLSVQKCFHLRDSGGFATKSHQSQRGGYHDRREKNVLSVFVLGHLLIEAESHPCTVLSQDGGVVTQDFVC